MPFDFVTGFVTENKVLFRAIHRKTEIPSARALTDLIFDEIGQHRGTLTKVINAQVSPPLRKRLDALLEKAEFSEEEETPQVQHFKLTLLKKISQSTRPSKIKATLDDWQIVRDFYEELSPSIAALDLTHDGIRYYANSVLKSQVFQVSRREEDERYLHLVCFIAHQFYRLQDTLIDILLKVVQNALNTCKRIHKESSSVSPAKRQASVSAANSIMPLVLSSAVLCATLLTVSTLVLWNL